MKPYLIEVNHLPSFGTDSPLDEDIKSRVVEQALSIVQVQKHDQRLYNDLKKKQSEERLLRGGKGVRAGMGMAGSAAASFAAPPPPSFGSAGGGGGGGGGGLEEEVGGEGEERSDKQTVVL